MRPSRHNRRAYWGAWLVSAVLHGTVGGLVLALPALWPETSTDRVEEWQVRLIHAATEESEADAPAEQSQPAPSVQPAPSETAPVSPTDEPDSSVDETVLQAASEDRQEQAPSVEPVGEALDSDVVDLPGGETFEAQPDVVVALAAPPNYEWLANDLWRQIEGYKRYPLIALRNGWEGEVVIRVAINGDGQVARAEIIESSGYRVLDQDALGLVQRATPIRLIQPWGLGHVTVSLPIRYRLQK